MFSHLFLLLPFYSFFSLHSSFSLPPSSLQSSFNVRFSWCSPVFLHSSFILFFGLSSVNSREKERDVFIDLFLLLFFYSFFSLQSSFNPPPLFFFQSSLDIFFHLRYVQFSFNIPSFFLLSCFFHSSFRRTLVCFQSSSAKLVKNKQNVHKHLVATVHGYNNCISMTH